MIRFLIYLFIFTNLSSFESKNTHNYIFPKWKEMILLNREILYSEDHKAFIDIYVNNIAKKSYILEEEQFKVGAIIVKPIYPKEERKNIARVTIMMKMQNGYDTENGNWWYGVYDESGLNASNTGRIKSCIMCHEIAEDTDYLFSESVMFDIQSQTVFKEVLKGNNLHKPK